MTKMATYHQGTHRLVSPEVTLDRIVPLLQRCGITRAARVTRLDSLNVPSFCSIRPDGMVLQVSNGKGLTDTDAKVSALMEALELHHAEQPLPDRMRRTCAAALRAEGSELLMPHDVHGYRDGYFGEKFECEWVVGHDLITRQPVWATASCVYFFRTPSLHNTSSNGLASGNHLIEATLHAIYELIERDAMTRLNVEGMMRIREQATVVDTASIDAPELNPLLSNAAADETQVKLMWLPSAVPIHTFWAVLLNRSSLAGATTFNVGWGTHMDKHVAAARALTEAAQSRLGAIHGAREDVATTPAFRASGVQATPAFRYFEQLQATATWGELDQRASLASNTDLESNLARLIMALDRGGHSRLISFDLTHPDKNIPVVKVIAPSLKFNHKMF